MHEEIRTHLLVCRKASLVDPIVDLVIDPPIELFDLGSVLSRQVRLASSRTVFRQKIVKCSVQYSDDLGALVVDDLLRLLIKEDWHGIAKVIAGVVVMIDLPDELLAKHRITGGLLRPSIECPALFGQLIVKNGHIDDALQLFQSANMKRATCPGTDQRHVEDVPAFLRWVFRSRCNRASKGRHLTTKLTIAACVLRD